MSDGKDEGGGAPGEAEKPKDAKAENAGTESTGTEESGDLTLNGLSEKEAERLIEAAETASHGHAHITLNVVQAKKRGFFTMPAW